MPVHSEHPEYTARQSQWQRCADVMEGSDAVKAQGETYLPRLEGQQQNVKGKDEYHAYKTRALFYNATARTLDGLAGLIFRKNTQLELPLSEQEEETLLADITQTGVTFDGLSKSVVRQVLGMGRAGILVDMPEPVAGQTQGQPFLQLYDARDIINWQSQRIDGTIRLSRVVLRESAMDPNPEDVFQPKLIQQYRELYLNDAGDYEVGIWREVENPTSTEDAWVKVQTLTPVLRGKPFRFIPFLVVNASTLTLSVEKPPLLDLVDVNLSHYRSSADLEHARHYTALPTPWVAGFDAGTELRIGSGTAWVSTDVNAKAEILEFKGSGLSELRNALQDKQTMMAVLGARLLEEKTSRQVEAADTIKTRQSGEQSILRSMVNTVSHALSQAMSWLIEWMGVSGTVKVELNRDFIDARLDPQEQSSLMLMLQSGAISYETYYYNLERGELTRPGITAEEEKALIDAQGGSVGVAAGTALTDESVDTAPAPADENP